MVYSYSLPKTLVIELIKSYCISALDSPSPLHLAKELKRFENLSSYNFYIFQNVSCSHFTSVYRPAVDVLQAGWRWTIVQSTLLVEGDRNNVPFKLQRYSLVSNAKCYTDDQKHRMGSNKSLHVGSLRGAPLWQRIGKRSDVCTMLAFTFSGV